MGWVWSYGHFFIFGAIAAVGAALAVNVDFLLHTAHMSGAAAGLVLAIPVAVYLVCLWLAAMAATKRASMEFPVAIGLCVAAAYLPGTVGIIAVILAGLTAYRVKLSQTPRAEWPAKGVKRLISSFCRGSACLGSPLHSGRRQATPLPQPAADGG